MPNIKALAQEKRLLRQETKRKRKTFWDKVWTIVIIALLASFVIWMIVTVISHHV